MKNILKTVTILMYLLFFTPTMVAQAESQDIKETQISFSDLKLYDLEGKEAVYSEIYGGTKTIVVIGRPECSRTYNTLDNLETYGYHYLDYNYKVLYLDFDYDYERIDLFRDMKVLCQYKFVDYYGCEEAYYQNQAQEFLEKIYGEEVSSIGFPLIFYVDEDGKALNFSEGTTVKFEDVQSFLGTDHFVYQVDYPYYNSDQYKERVLAVNKLRLDSMKTNQNALKYYARAYDKSDAVKEKSDEIVNGLNTDSDKVKAIYNWITANIYFDQDAYDESDDESDYKSNYIDASDVLSEKKSVSKGIAKLFHDLLAAQGIPSCNIFGYKLSSRQWSQTETCFPKTNHAWNYVYYDGRWRLFDVACDTHNQYKNGNWLEGEASLEYYDCTVEKLSEQHKIVDQSVLFVIPEIASVTEAGNDLLVKWNKEVKSTGDDHILVSRADHMDGTYEVIGILINNVQYKVVNYNSETTTYDRNTAREVEPGQFYDEYTEQGEIYYYKVFQRASLQSDPMEGQAPVCELNDLTYEEKDGYLTFRCTPVSRAYTYKLNRINKRTGEEYTVPYDRKTPEFIMTSRVSDTYEFWISAINTFTGKTALESNHVTYVGKGNSSLSTGKSENKKDVGTKPDLRTISNAKVQSNSSSAVGRISIGSVRNKKKRSFTAKWKKVTEAKGYQIQYAVSKKKLSKGKRKNVKKASVTIKKLKKKKTYYVRVRAYKVVGGRNVYGKWSIVKKVKIKK